MPIRYNGRSSIMIFGKVKNEEKQFQELQEKEIQIVEEKEVSNNNLLNECLDYFIQSQPKELSLVQRGIKSKDSLMNEVERYLKGRKIKESQISEIKEMFAKYIWGYHILEDLICDENISDIKIISKDLIRVKIKGERYTSSVKFTSVEEVNRFIRIVAIKNRINVSDINAKQTFTDKQSNKDYILRITIVTDYITSAGHPYLHIRKIPKRKYTPEQLIEMGLATKEQMKYLINAIKSGKKIIFTGKGASGKTTILNTLIDEISHNKSGMVIQENEELFSSTHPDLMFLKVRSTNGEGKIQYSLKDLTISGLLMDIDYFIIGEIKGAEALYFLNAAKTGHVCLCSVHGENSTEAVDKIVDYMKYESDYSRADLLKMLKSIDIVVYMENFKCNEISEIVGYDYSNEELKYNTIYKNQVRTGAEIQKVQGVN
jgi:pilus assembly protein CpaF